MSWLTEHGDDLVPVRQIDLLSLIARLRQADREGKIEHDASAAERLITCDLPRLTACLPPEALAVLDESGLRAGPPVMSQLGESDRLMLARAAEIGPALRAGGSDRDRLAGWLLHELAAIIARLDAARETGAPPPAAFAVWCKGCSRTGPSLLCGRCGGQACANCGRCPACDGPL